MSVRLFAVRGGLLALETDGVRVAGLAAGAVGPASEALLRGEAADVVLPGADRIPFAELSRVSAPVLGRRLELSWGTRRRSVRFGDRKTRDAAFEALASLAPGMERSRDRVPRGRAALLPLGAAALSALGLWGSASWGRRGLGVAAMGLSLCWLALWLWRPPDRMRLERPSGANP